MLSYEDDEIRMRIIKQSDLYNEVINSGKTVKWGQYLRAPDIYFEILEKCSDKFIPLGKIANIRFGIKTGVNEFFYLTDEKIKHWQIEDEFLKPVIKSPKESEAIILKEDDLKQKVFLCHKDKTELKGTNALRYINWGESQTTATGEKWPEVPSVAGRKNWYDLSKRKPGQFLVPMITGNSLRGIINKKKVQVDHNLFEILSKEKDVLEALGIFLNSSVCFIQRELTGRANLGDGALKLEGIDWKRILVPDKNLLNEINKKCKKSFDNLCKRKIRSIGQEAKRKDRMDFEMSVLRALGLKEESAKDILKGVIDLVDERHLLPTLRKTKKKARKDRDLSKLCDEVAEEVFGAVPTRFPDGFVKGWGKIDCDEICITAKKIKLGETFFDKQEICDENGKHVMEFFSLDKAKFAVYAKDKDEQIVKIPQKQVVLKKAIQDYEFYLKELKSKLLLAFIEKCNDQVLSYNLTKKVFEDYNLPSI